ncbi:class I SAM-dependent methyltransferase [Saccharothrix sp. Mg75]|uniref:class I SAM-dependent methyltransferase n=1 Tax=Saccharothrix sp. Mg75 TaxID=3445357 RepID=UPI003EEE2C44
MARQAGPMGFAVDDYEQHSYQTMLDHLPERLYRRVLDAGCSEGVFTELLAARYPQAEVVGVDITQRPVDRARAGSASGSGKRPRYLRLDIVSDDLDDRYDVVICAEMLYHLGRPERCGSCADD